MNSEILENKVNFIITKENNLIKLFSYKSLVSIYNIDAKTFEEVPYNFTSINGISCSYSKTTVRHISKFKKYIKYNF